MEHGQLRLTEPQAAIGPKPSVNHFFHSLADEAGEQAIGIILSGTGSDGAAGIRAIKAAGGITIAQEPETAKYDGMPKAAIHTVTPVVSPLDVERKALLLISFLTTRLEEENRPALANATSDERDNLIIRELEQELANTRTHLNVVVEELETSNEELQSLNEELQSTNEELQSANEELQTANEELQSTNEELLTVNEELQVKSAELETTASDLINVKESLTFPLIVVDAQLRITQVNAACNAIVVVDAPLEGSALNSVQWQIEVAGLSGLVRGVLNDGQQHWSVVRSEQGATYALHIMPYRQEQSAIAGAVLVFEDITVQHEAEQALRESEARISRIIDIMPEAVLLIDEQGRIQRTNQRTAQIFAPRTDRLARPAGGSAASGAPPCGSCELAPGIYGRSHHTAHGRGAGSLWLASGWA